MKKRMSVFSPSGKWIEFEEGKESVSSIRCLGPGLISVLYEYMDGDTKVSKETVYSGMPFILADV